MKKCYLVNYSHGSYEDYRDLYLSTVFLSLSSAEKAKEEFEISQKTEAPFPTDKITQEEWLDGSTPSIFDIISSEEYNIIDAWQYEKWHKESFNKAWITELILEDGQADSI